MNYTPFAPLGLWKIAYQHPINHDEYQTRVRPSAFGVDLAECQTRIHSVDFGVEGVYRTRIPENLNTSGAKGLGLKSDLYIPPIRGHIPKLTSIVIFRTMYTYRNL